MARFVLLHVTPSELILCVFVAGCALTILLAEWNPWRRRDDEDDDDGEGPLTDVALP